MQEMRYVIPRASYQMRTRYKNAQEKYGTPNMFCDVCNTYIRFGDKYFVDNEGRYRFCWDCYDFLPHVV